LARSESPDQTPPSSAWERWQHHRHARARARAHSRWRIGEEYAREADDAGGFADSMIVQLPPLMALLQPVPGVAALFGAVAAGGVALKTGDCA